MSSFYEQTEIRQLSLPAILFLFPANANTEINCVTVNRLYPEHSDFCEFPKRISEDCKLGNGGSKYDVVKTPEELKVFVGSKGIR